MEYILEWESRLTHDTGIRDERFNAPPEGPGSAPGRSGSDDAPRLRCVPVDSGAPLCQKGVPEGGAILAAAVVGGAVCGDASPGSEGVRGAPREDAVLMVAR